MKTLYLSNSCANIVVDQEANTCDAMSRCVESIRSIYLADEPMHVVYQYGDKRREFDVEKDDIIVTFYSSEFSEPVIVAKSADWVKNIKDYREAEQKRKEEWAAKQAINEITTCDNDACGTACCPA